MPHIFSGNPPDGNPLLSNDSISANTPVVRLYPSHSSTHFHHHHFTPLLLYRCMEKRRQSRAFSLFACFPHLCSSFPLHVAGIQLLEHDCILSLNMPSDIGTYAFERLFSCLRSYFLYRWLMTFR